MRRPQEIPEVEGWRNGATHRLALFIDNDRAELGYWLRVAAESCDSEAFRDTLRARLELRVEAQTANRPEAEALAGWAVGWVDWDELAAHLYAKYLEGASVPEAGQ